MLHIGNSRDKIGNMRPLDKKLMSQMDKRRTNGNEHPAISIAHVYIFDNDRLLVD